MVAAQPWSESASHRQAEALLPALRAAGHAAEVLRLPFSPGAGERLVDEMLIFRTLQVRQVDRVLTLDFPSCLLNVPAKVAWLAGPFAVRPAQASMVRKAEQAGLSEARHVFAWSHTGVAELAAIGIRARLLAAPGPEPEHAGWGDLVGQLLE